MLDDVLSRMGVAGTEQEEEEETGAEEKLISTIKANQKVYLQQVTCNKPSILLCVVL